MDTILFSSVRTLAEKLRSGQITAKWLTERYMERIEKINPDLNAVVTLNTDAAIKKAQRLDAALDRKELAGPLHGIPMTIKDSFDTAGVVTTGGTLGRRDFRPDRSATVVTRLEKAGAILLGKTNTSELTLSYDTDNPVFGRTVNPFDPSRTPGGSSGGGAAIVASGGSAFDIGSDYGGSLRFPAHCCGIATIKPTSGRVPRTGHILPFGGLLDTFQQVGPLVRKVEDLMLILKIIAGPDHIDPSIVPMPLGPDKRDATDLRISFHTDNGVLKASAEIDQTVRHAAALLQQWGCRVDEARPAAIEETHDLAMALWGADGGASIERLLETSGTVEHSIRWLGKASALGAVELDALIMRWFDFKSRMLAFMNDFDIILSPVHAFPAMKEGFMGQDLSAFSYTSAYNLTGWPAVVIQGGVTETGLPIGIQIVAAPWHESTALAIAGLLEKRLGDFPHP